jgi:hypothetical protein
VIHGDAAARVALLAPPVGPPLLDALGVRVAERLQGDQRDPADGVGVEDAAHRLDDRRVLVVVAGEDDALHAARVVEEAPRLLDRGGERLLAEHVQPAIEGGVRDLRVGGGRRADVDEVEPARLLLQQLDVALVDARLRIGRARRVAAGGADVRDGVDLQRRTVLGEGRVRGAVPLRGDEPVADDRTR